MDINLNDLLRHYRSNPYEEHEIRAPHTGVVTFRVEEGQQTFGPSGKWLHKPGTLLFLLDRENNPKRINASFNGEVAGIRHELEGCFVEAGTLLLTIRHRLSKEEIIDRMLTEVLSIFPAPQRARYYLPPETASQMDKKAEPSISLKPGDDAIIMSLMKRDTILKYEGTPGIIYKVYFNSGDMVEQNAPLLGICPPDNLQYVQKVIQRIKNEWEE